MTTHAKVNMTIPRNPREFSTPVFDENGDFKGWTSSVSLADARVTAWIPGNSTEQIFQNAKAMYPEAKSFQIEREYEPPPAWPTEDDVAFAMQIPAAESQYSGLEHPDDRKARRDDEKRQLDFDLALFVGGVLIVPGIIWFLTEIV